MSDPVWLPEVLRAAGLVVHEYPGWRERGHGDFGSIWGIVVHHTGSFGESPRGIAEHPELGLASQLYLSREGEYTICGVGIAWHAGMGSYLGLPDDEANQYTIGIEAANDGGGTPGKPHHLPWPDKQYDAYVRGVAAILEHLDQPSSHVIGHKEWAGREQGKWDPGGIDMNIFRADVERVRDGGQLGDGDMPSADDIAKAVWAAQVAKPNGKTEQAGILLGWTDQHSGDALDQAGGPGTKDQRGGPLRPTGWTQLGKNPDGSSRSLVDAVAAALKGIEAINTRLDALEIPLEPEQR
jgi:hypothetical protein